MGVQFAGSILQMIFPFPGSLSHIKLNHKADRFMYTWASTSQMALSPSLGFPETKLCLTFSSTIQEKTLHQLLMLCVVVTKPESDIVNTDVYWRIREKRNVWTGAGDETKRIFHIKEKKRTVSLCGTSPHFHCILIHSETQLINNSGNPSISAAVNFIHVNSVHGKRKRSEAKKGRRLGLPRRSKPVIFNAGDLLHPSFYVICKHLTAPFFCRFY